MSELPLDEQRKLIIYQELRPLYRFLERNRYDYSTQSFADGRFEIVIWELIPDKA